MNLPESRIAALEAQLAEMVRIVHEMRIRLESQNEDIGAVAELVNTHIKSNTAYSIAVRNGQGALEVK